MTMLLSDEKDYGEDDVYDDDEQCDLLSLFSWYF